jgi:hypothetical protein
MLFSYPTKATYWILSTDAARADGACCDEASLQVCLSLGRDVNSDRGNDQIASFLHSRRGTETGERQLRQCVGRNNRQILVLRNKTSYCKRILTMTDGPVTPGRPCWNEAMWQVPLREYVTRCVATE